MGNPFSKLPSDGAKPVKPRKTLTAKPGFNAKPTQEQAANAGAMPNIMGDAAKATLSSRPTLPGAGLRTLSNPSQSSGIDAAMGALADRIHPTGR